MGDIEGKVHFLFLIVFMASGVIVSCRMLPPSVSICDLQGAGGSSPYLNQEVSIRGVVSADFDTTHFSGFSAAETNLTGEAVGSCGIWVEMDKAADAVSTGDLVEFQIRVEEVQGETRGVFLPGSLQIQDLDQPTPRPVFLNLDLVPNREENWERLEGSLVRVPVVRLLSSSSQPGRTSVVYQVDYLSEGGELSGEKGLQMRFWDPAGTGLLQTASAGDAAVNLCGILREDLDGYFLVLVQENSSRLLPLSRFDGLAAGSDQESELLQTPFQVTQTPAAAATSTPTATTTPFPVRLLITEVMVNPSGKEPDGEWIELFNRDDFAVPLGDVKLGDAVSPSGKEGMVRFPPGFMIPGKGVVVVAHSGKAFRGRFGKLPDFELVDSLDTVPDLIAYPGWAGSKVLLSNSGDEVLLLDGWDRILDQLSYGKSDLKSFPEPVEEPCEGCSLERYPPEKDRNQAGDWRERENPSPGRLDRSPPTAAPSPTPSDTLTPSQTWTPSLTPTPDVPSATPPVLELLISEVMVNPSGVEPGGEWVEIYHPGAQALPLGYVKVGDAADPADREGMMTFPEDAVLQPGDLVVIANRGEIFRDQFGFLPDFEINPTLPQVEDLLPYPAWSGNQLQFSNQGDELILLDGWDQVLDAVAFGDSPSPVFQPALEAPREGETLIRLDLQSGVPVWSVNGDPSPGEMNRPLITPSPSPTSLPTAAPTDSATPTALCTASRTPDPSAAPTNGGTGTATLTPSPTLTPSSPSASPTSSPGTLTPTGLTPTLSLTPDLRTPTASPVPYTPTSTPNTENPTGTATLDLASSTPSLEPSASSTSSASVTPTAAETPTPGSALLLNEIQADPHPEEGDANRDGVVSSDDDEFLELVNLGTDPLDLSEWTISDRVRVRYTFPDGVQIQPGCGVVVFGGGDPPDSLGGCAVLTAGSLGLNNGGDQITVRDGDQNLIFTVEYGPEGGEDQSLTRSPDLAGDLPLVLHSEIPDSGGSRFSPGTLVDGNPFPGCSP